MSDRTWHITKPGSWPEGQTKLYCGVELEQAAPFILGIEAIVHHAGKLPVCKKCWEEATKKMTLVEEA